MSSAAIGGGGNTPPGTGWLPGAARQYDPC